MYVGVLAFSWSFIFEDVMRNSSNHLAKNIFLIYMY